MSHGMSASGELGPHPLPAAARRRSAPSALRHYPSSTIERALDYVRDAPQRLCEADLVTIRVGQVKEPRAPFGIARRRVRAIAGRDNARMKRVDVGMVEDEASPPRPRSLGGL